MNVDFSIDYDLALTRIAGELTERQKDLLAALYFAHDDGVAAGLLAPLLGLTHHAPLNATFASLGKALTAAVGAEAPTRADGTRRWWHVVATDRRADDGRFYWILRAPLRAIVAKHGLVPNERAIFPDVVVNTGDPAEPLLEGAVIRVAANVYERNPVARRRCIEHYGARCAVCDFVFADFYGPTTEGVIHVHHLTPLAEAGGVDYVIDPIRDLRPVCPNCHVVIHHKQPPLTLDEARALVGSRR